MLNILVNDGIRQHQKRLIYNALSHNITIRIILFDYYFIFFFIVLNIYGHIIIRCLSVGLFQDEVPRFNALSAPVVFKALVTSWLLRNTISDYELNRPPYVSYRGFWIWICLIWSFLDVVRKIQWKHFLYIYMSKLISSKQTLLMILKCHMIFTEFSHSFALIFQLFSKI